MTSTVFLSGSRTISRLNDSIRDRLKNMIRQGFRIIVGDANGADKALQGYLADTGYENVTVYCSGGICRNNLDRWPTMNVAVDFPLTGRDFYMQKDKRMAGDADYGFVLWDGKSAGSINNVFELLKRDKTVVVYQAKTKAFSIIKRPEHLGILLDHCESSDLEKINNKINVNRQLRELNAIHQGNLNL